MNNSFQRVVRVTSLADFQKEVPPEPNLRGQKPIVRLLESRVTHGHFATLSVSLQGVNSDGEVFWLCERHEVSWLHGKPFGKEAESFAQCVRDLRELVQAHLEALGYDVRAGDYGLPDNIRPLSANFEIARWRKNEDDTFSVEANHE